MYYEIRGEGKPAVYIHPVAACGGMVAELPRNRQWIVPDLQGHGRTPDIDRAMSCRQHADDIAALLKKLSIERADFFGDSFGGTIAVMMAVRHPELAVRVVSYSGSLAAYPKGDGAAITAESDLVKWPRENYKSVAPYPEKWPVLFAKATQALADWKGFSAEELKGIKAPVLIACGDHDLISVEQSAEWARAIPGGQLAVIPDASHFVLMSEPEKLLPTMAAFLDAPISKLEPANFKHGFYPGRTR